MKTVKRKHFGTKYNCFLLSN